MAGSPSRKGKRQPVTVGNVIATLENIEYWCAIVRQALSGLPRLLELPAPEMQTGDRIGPVYATGACRMVAPDVLSQPPLAAGGCRPQKYPPLLQHAHEHPKPKTTRKVARSKKS